LTGTSAVTDVIAWTVWDGCDRSSWASISRRCSLYFCLTWSKALPRSINASFLMSSSNAFVTDRFRPRRDA
jgi:hypothetical protein